MSNILESSDQKVRLIFRKVADRRVIPDSTFVRSLHPEIIIEQALDELVVSLQAFVAVEHLTGTEVTRTVGFHHTMETYASWWQHTKAVHFPTISRWLRRPPRMVKHIHEERRRVTIVHEQYAAYPEANLPQRPEDVFGRPLIWEAWGRESERILDKNERWYDPSTMSTVKPPL
jgi:hypothetical protein